MKSLAIVLVLTLFMVGCGEEERNTELEGQWRSNIELTLSSIENSENISDTMQSVLAGPSLGNEIWEFKQNKSRYMVIDSGDDWDFAMPFQSYEILEENEDFFLIEAHGIDLEPNQYKFLRDGKCFYELYEKTNIKYYFCKV